MIGRGYNASPQDLSRCVRREVLRSAERIENDSRLRIAAELKRQGWEVNHKRVGRILREDNLLCLRKRKFHLSTDSRHSFRIDPNLTRNFVPVAPNRLWFSDIIYIRSLEEFVYLAVVRDAYSLLLIGWALERTLEVKLLIGALRMAIKRLLSLFDPPGDANREIPS